jgi:hypothetical protein
MVSRAKRDYIAWLTQESIFKFWYICCLTFDIETIIWTLMMVLDISPLNGYWEWVAHYADSPLSNCPANENEWPIMQVHHCQNCFELNYVVLILNSKMPLLGLKIGNVSQRLPYLYRKLSQPKSHRVHIHTHYQDYKHNQNHNNQTICVLLCSMTDNYPSLKSYS